MMLKPMKKPEGLREKLLEIHTGGVKTIIEDVEGL